MVYKIWFDKEKIYIQNPDLVLKSPNVKSPENKEFGDTSLGELIELGVNGSYITYRIVVCKKRFDLGGFGSEPVFDPWYILAVEEVK